MSERRPLVAGLKPAADPDRALETNFVYGQGANVPPAPAPADKPVVKAAPIGRVPFTTRVRADVAHALKRASLERQLAGVEPHTVQDILEDALVPWLRANGYLL